MNYEFEDYNEFSGLSFSIDRLPACLDIAWAAGLYEGEGSIVAGIDRTNPANVYYRATIQLGSTDEDTVERFTSVLNNVLNVNAYIYKPKMVAQLAQGHKQSWQTRVGNYKGIVKTIKSFWPWLGRRRREQALYILDKCSLRGPVNGERCHASKLSRDKVTLLKHRYLTENVTMQYLADEMGVTFSSVQRILCGRTWKHTSTPEEQVMLAAKRSANRPNIKHLTPEQRAIYDWLPEDKRDEFIKSLK